MTPYPDHMFFTSESVAEGHPDKFCDQVSDAVLDECLRQDPDARVACECYVTMGALIIGGEITSTALFDPADVARQVGNAIGYSSPEYGFDVNTAAILRTIHAQSPDIARGVMQAGGQIGAGDQGLMFGYACSQTPELMPLPIQLAHRLATRLADVRKRKELPYLGPDGKTQVTVEYQGGKPLRVDHVVIAASHTAAVVTRDGTHTTDEAKQEIVDQVVRPVIGGLLDERTTIVVNGTGKFLVSGPQGDTGLTGRKIIVDTYGGWSVHGGGAFSGKDATKVDRSAGYMTRYIAKNIVAAGLADQCLVQVGYCIGVVDPVSVMVHTYGTGTIGDDALAAVVRQVFPLSPRGIIDHLHLREPVYAKTAAYGHFGRNGFTWEHIDATDELLAKARSA
ncbi:S-adenosylmethionine synthase [Luteitalea sp. TBR-22]|uniref:methionine adenosyltransferase n=1 Tax=Luteitalea sp. TBR-22 TaxID=2802971 RepID=UPI001AF92353|nr:methionine adenosyltransferase [Luteitalea sp. TBR-22]BCS32052.1 S-adenosylmethionine synthase [Luteitalea sp. TBR-22]